MEATTILVAINLFLTALSPLIVAGSLFIKKISESSCLWGGCNIKTNSDDEEDDKP